jgi:hypothetical protein
MVPVPSKMETRVWFWFGSSVNNNTGSGFVSENQTWFRGTWSEPDG